MGEPLAGHESGGWFYAWWQGDPLPPLDRLEGFGVEPSDDVELLARLGGLAPEGVRERLLDGHRAYVATVGGEPVAYGWSATQSADIGELGIRLRVPVGERYLWDFVTLPVWRGKGVYPRLLQAILPREAEEGAVRFWIGHAADNHASRQGILRAGFLPIGELHFLHGSGMAMAPTGPLERAVLGANLLGIELLAY